MIHHALQQAGCQYRSGGNADDAAAPGPSSVSVLGMLFLCVVLWAIYKTASTKRARPYIQAALGAFVILSGAMFLWSMIQFIAR